jgi:hypothetical protein
MREALRKLDEAIEQLRRVPDSNALLAHLELVRHGLMERVYQQVTGRRAVVNATPFKPAA